MDKNTFSSVPHPASPPLNSPDLSAPDLSAPDLSAPKLGSRLARVIREEIGEFSPRLWLAERLMRLLPTGAAGRVRAALYRAAGLGIGPKTLVIGPLTLMSPRWALRNLRVGARCFLNSPLFVDAAAPVTLGDGVSVGHHVVIVTTSHAVGPAAFRAGNLRAMPVTVEDGAWIAANVTLLPGVTVGHGAVVAAGAVVTKDVAPNTLVGGVPAKFIRALETA